MSEHVDEWATGFLSQDSSVFCDGLCKTFITERVGGGVYWDTYWEVSNHNDPDKGNWIFIHTSRPWVFKRIQKDRNKIEISFSDNNHIMLFPQDVKGICPRAWLEAAWPFIAHFRSNFTLYPQLAFFYRKVTIIGHPHVQPSVSQGLENELRELGRQRQVERIWCRNAKELAKILLERIEHNIPFPEPDQGDLATRTAK